MSNDARLVLRILATTETLEILHLCCLDGCLHACRYHLGHGSSTYSVITRSCGPSMTQEVDNLITNT